MLFMGQEFAASAPFFYFADHEPELAELVRKGRMEFMSQFPSLALFKPGPDMPAPSEPVTFARCKLDWSEREQNQQTVHLHRDLLRLRRQDPVFSRQDKTQIEGAVIGPEALVLRWFDENDEDRLLLLNLGRAFDWYPLAEPLTAAPDERHWSLLWSSEHPRYGGFGIPAFKEQQWRLPGHSAVVLAAGPGGTQSNSTDVDE
jgi:maltooligosyltrehalose trehalohydrolase